MSDQKEWVIEVTSALLPEPMRYTLTADDTSELFIGRNDARSETKADIDLSDMEAAKKGVSRLHAKLQLQDDQLLLYDLDTSNGTVLNGQKLQSERGYPLTGTDAVVLGALRLNIKIASRPETENELENDATIPTADPAGDTDRLTRARDMVLIVEDHIEVAQLFSMILQKRGFDTHISRDAARAMRYLQNKQPDAVILDLMLPGMNGTEVCRYIRRDSSLDQTAIVIVSANRNPGTERAAYDAGADAFISKPVNAEELAKTVERYVRKRKSGILDDVTRELTDRDATKGLDETQIEEMDVGISDDTVAVVVAGHTDRPFTVTVSRPMTFGRGSYATPATHVDLGRFNAKDKGVSRMHVRMTRENGKFYVEDMDSMNGTFVNGDRLPPNQPTEIRSGQEVRIGSLAMNVYFMSEALKENKKHDETPEEIYNRDTVEAPESKRHNPDTAPLANGSKPTPVPGDNND